MSITLSPLHRWVVYDRKGEFAGRFSNRGAAEHTVLTRGLRGGCCHIVGPQGEIIPYSEISQSGIVKQRRRRPSRSKLPDSFVIWSRQL